VGEVGDAEVQAVFRGYGGNSRRIVVTFGAEVECTESEGAEALALHQPRYCGRQGRNPVRLHVPQLSRTRVYILANAAPTGAHTFNTITHVDISLTPPPK
jgi:hypothetical protein